MGRYYNDVYTVPSLLDVENKRRYYPALLDPIIEKSVNDIYVITTIGDRLDLLAFKYFSDQDLWWIISAANPEIRKDSLYLDPGIQIRIPAAYIDVLTEYYKQNSSR